METIETPTTEVLLEVIRTLQAQISAFQAMNTTLQAQHAADRERSQREVARLVKMVQGLTRQLDELLKNRDEERRAELARLLAEALASAAAATSGTDATTAAGTAGPPPSGPPPKTKNRHEHGRGPKPEGVPRDVRTTRPKACAKCGGSDNLRDGARAEPVEEWDYVRAHLRLRITQPLACTCGDCGVVTPAPETAMPFDRASCTFAMMAWLCFAKCGMFLPIDRICRDFAAQGAPIPSATLTRWWQRGADLLLPVAASVRVSLLADSHLRMDGTGLLVVFPRQKGEPVKGPKRPGDTDADGYLLPKLPLGGQILVFGNDEHAVFTFTPTREGRHALDFLTMGQDEHGHPIRWRGTITADALSAYDCLYEGGERTETGCNAHAYRKFRDDADKAPLLASAALAFLGSLFDVEAHARTKGLRGAELLADRQKRAKPIADTFRAWIDEHIEDLLPTNPVRKAMKYYLNQWSALTRYLDDPDVLMDNNWAERALRKVALLRNNSLYASGEDGAIRLCTLFTLIGTCRLLAVDAYEYLLWALARSVPHPDNRGVVASDLTPAAYKATISSIG